MPNRVYITRFIAGILLVVFAFGITPKRLLHDMLAKHNDCRSCKNNGSSQLENAGYHCGFDNLVAESAFIHELPQFSVVVNNYFSSYINKNISFSTVPEIYSALRGPPVNS